MGPSERRTVALLITDVVDSTRRLEQLGDDRAAEVWAAHDDLARRLLSEHEGREIDKSDGFLLLFDEPGRALEFARAYHAALAELEPPLLARAGLHVAEVHLRENAPDVVARGAKPLEVDGIAKPVVARIMGLAVGGQTLASPEAVRALGLDRVQAEPDGRVAAEGLLALSHGHWRLKGVTEPVELFEVGMRGDAPMTPPPDADKAWRVVWQNEAWVPLRQIKHHLPAERDAFVGRTALLQQLATILDDGARLVSVLGIGGTGKTRLVLHYGWTWLGGWPGGVWFCDLSEARGVDGIAHAVATALGIPLGRDDTIVQLGHAIAGRGRCLVVLDNFEQVARHAAQTLGRWLDRAAEAQFVVTTREVLGLPGEASLPLPPLEHDEAVALFDARARQAKPSYVPDPNAVGPLVELLDALPLAIELAAARVSMMSPAKVLERIGDRFRLLTSTGGRRDRQATLRATLDWSWELLSEDEQSALAQVSVFEGGFTLEAAEAVLSLGELWPLDAVQSLVHRSLVRQVEDDRYDLLVSVQAYASEKLGEARAGAEARHGAWFAAFGDDEALDGLETHGGVARWWALARELDNVVVACRRAMGGGDGAVAVATLGAVWAVVRRRGPRSTAASLTSAVLTLQGLEPEVQARRAALAGVAGGPSDAKETHLVSALELARSVGDRRLEGRILGNLFVAAVLRGRLDEARADLDAGLALHREVGDRRSEGIALGNLGNLHFNQGRLEDALACYEAALSLHREVGDRRFEGIVLGNIAVVHNKRGRMDEAVADCHAALAIHQETGDTHSEGVVLGTLGSIHHDQGRFEDAGACYEAALSLQREVGDRRYEGRALRSLAILRKHEGRTDEARACYEAALSIHREVGDRHAEGETLGNLGVVHHEQGRLLEAQFHYHAALAILQEYGGSSLPGLVLANLGRLHLEQGQLGEARHLVEDGERRVREAGQAVFLVSVLCTRVLLEAREGRLETARATMAEVTALADGLGHSSDRELAQSLSRARAAVGGDGATQRSEGP